jgi:hypothetical protein
MKQIIKGKKYDTDTATKIYEYQNEYGYSDFRYVIETLYIKKTGEYFLHGEGGAMSKYCQKSGSNTTCGGAEIIPLDRCEAFDWGSDNMPVDKFEAHFGEVEE